MTTGKGDSTSGCDIYTITEEEKTGKVAALGTPSQVITHTKVYYIYYYNAEGYPQYIDTVELGEKRDTKVYEEGVFKITEDGLLDFIDDYAYNTENKIFTFPQDSLEIPETVNNMQVKEIRPWFLTAVTGIKKVTIKANIQSIPDRAFSNKDLEEIELPDGILNIDTFAFFSCSKLNKVNIPNTVTNISYRAFYNCRNLRNIELSSNLKKLESGAFAYCTGLQSITIPASVNNIDVNLDEEGRAWGAIFENCTNLNEVNIKKGSPLLVNGEVPEELATKLGVDKSKIKIVD